MVNGLPSKQKLWVRFPLSVIIIMNKIQDAHRTLSRIRGYFCRKGNLESIENKLSKIFISNSQKKLPFKWSPGFISFSKLTNYRNLKKIVKGRAKKKKVIYKIKPRIKRDNSQKSYRLIAPSITKASKTSKTFTLRLEKELKGLQKTIFKRSTDLTKAEPVFFEKRDFLHKIAYNVVPKKWKKKVKKKKKRTKFILKKRKIFKKKYKKYILFKKLHFLEINFKDKIKKFIS